MKHNFASSAPPLFAPILLGMAIVLSSGCKKKASNKGEQESLSSNTNLTSRPPRDSARPARVERHSRPAAAKELDDLRENSGDRGNYSKITELIPDLSLADLQEAFDFATSTLSASEARSVKHEIFNRLAREDPEAGWALLDSVSAGTDRQSFIGTLIGNMSFEDACAFIDRLAELPFPEDDRPARSGILTALQKADTTELHKLLGNSGNKSASVRDLVARAYGRSAARDGLRFEQLVKSIDTSEPTSETIIHSWAGNRSVMAPKEFASELISIPLNTNQKETLLPLAIGNLAVQDPKAAVLLSNGLGDTPGSRASMSVAMGHWIRTDSHQASEWLAQQPPNYLREVAALQIVNHLSRQNAGGESSGWIESINDPELRDLAERAESFHNQNNPK